MIIALIFVCAVALLTLKSVNLYQDSKEKGKLIATLVREQARLLEVSSDRIPVLSQQGWPDDFVSLQAWVVSKLASSQDPLLTATQLKAISSEHSFSPVMSTTLRRWDQQLTEWAKAAPIATERNPQELLTKGRIKCFEGTGYRAVGRESDAIPLFVQSIYALTRFIEISPSSHQVPEALYLLGLSYLRLKQALPAQVRADRILNAVAEFYPGTIWARQAAAIRSLETEKGAA